MVIKLLHSGRHGNLWSNNLDPLDLELVPFERGDIRKMKLFFIFLSPVLSFILLHTLSFILPFFLLSPSLDIYSIIELNN